jgi:hypothetical protein
VTVLSWLMKLGIFSLLNIRQSVLLWFTEFHHFPRTRVREETFTLKCLRLVAYHVYLWFYFVWIVLVCAHDHCEEI